MATVAIYAPDRHRDNESVEESGHLRVVASPIENVDREAQNEDGPDCDQSATTHAAEISSGDEPLDCASVREYTLKGRAFPSHV